MLDHWHALFALREPWTLPKFMHDLMSYVGARTSQLLRGHKTSWQDGYYDTLVKTARQFEYVRCYIEQNPVVKGLVERPEQWEGSSASRRDLITEPWPYLYDEGQIGRGTEAPPTLQLEWRALMWEGPQCPDFPVRFSFMFWR